MSKDNFDFSKYSAGYYADPSSYYNTTSIKISRTNERDQQPDDNDQSFSLHNNNSTNQEHMKNSHFSTDKSVSNVTEHHASSSAKGSRQLASYFDYSKWADEVGWAAAVNTTEDPNGIDNKKESLQKFTPKEIKALKIRKEAVKKKQKYGWLYKD